jgi:hypothetical protein
MWQSAGDIFLNSSIALAFGLLCQNSSSSGRAMKCEVIKQE